MVKREGSNYIGFGIRFIATAIDSIIFFIVFWIFGRIFIFLPFSLIKITLMSIAINLLVEALYEIFLTSKYGGTIGKILMKCRVVDSNGNNIPLSISTARYFSKWLSILAVGFGYLMIIWDEKKQGLHDKIAETYVINDSNNRVKQKLKKILIVITLLIIFGYIFYFIYFAVLGVAVVLRTESKEIDANDPLNSVITNCESKFPYYKSVCISQFSELGEIEKLNVSTRLELCSIIKSKQFHNECLTTIAVLEENISICDNSKSNYYETICKKVYSFTSFFVDSLFQEEKLEFNGTLNVDSVGIGVQAGDKCIEVENNEFTFDDNFCLIFNNIGPLEKGEDGYYWFDVGLQVYDDENKLIFSYDKSLDEEGHLKTSNSFKNDILKKHTLELILSGIIAEEGPGTYTYNIAVYDRISNNGVYVNRTLKVSDNYNKKLKIESDMLGVVAEGQGCVSKSNNFFTKKDSICYHTYNVSKFDKNNEGLNLFSMDLFIINSSGDIVEDGINIYDENGLVVLKNGLLNSVAEESSGVKQSLSSFPMGDYTFEFVVKDRIGKKQAKTSNKFVIVDNKTSFIVDWYKIGSYDGFNCNSRNPTKFSPQESICFEPFASNLEEDLNGKIHFNMDQTIYSAKGERMYYESDSFGNYGETLNSPLLGHFVIVSLSDYPNGQYIYEVTIKDLISKEEVVSSERFTVNENTSIFYSELDNFMNKYRNAIVDTIELGETKTYTVTRVDYETLVLYMGPQGVRLMINGWVSDYLKSGDTQKLPKGEMLLVNNLIKTESGDSVEFALGR